MQDLAMLSILSVILTCIKQILPSHISDSLMFHLCQLTISICLSIAIYENIENKLADTPLKDYSLLSLLLAFILQEMFLHIIDKSQEKILDYLSKLSEKDQDTIEKTNRYLSNIFHNNYKLTSSKNKIEFSIGGVGMK